MTETAATTRTVLVTGASSGIGAAICLHLLDRGHRVVGVSRTTPAFLDREGFAHLRIDLADLEQLPAQFAQCIETEPTIDAVVSNAGVPAFGFLEQTAPEKIRRSIDFNLTSHILLTRALIPHLKRNDSSDLIFIGSEAALRGAARGSLYCAAKFGLRGFAQSLRHECAASGLRVTILQPGMVRTPFFDDIDFAPGEDPDNAIEPEDVARAVSLALEARSGTVFEEIILRPLKTVVVRKPGH